MTITGEDRTTMGKPVIKRTATDGQFNWHNGERGSLTNRGGLLEISTMQDPADGRTRIDLYNVDRGTRVLFGATGTDAWGQVANQALAALWTVETTDAGHRDTTVTEDGYRWAVLRALGVCEVSGRVDCQERDCELHYMDAPLKLAHGPEVKASERGKAEGTREHLEADVKSAEVRRRRLEELVREVTALQLESQRDETEARDRLSVITGEL